MTKSRVIVVVPVYKIQLDIFERVSISQLKRVLGRYDIAFVAPLGLDFDYGIEYSDWRVERFPDMYFQNGTSAYSALLLSPQFYRRFDDYDFMLIYHTDALVFSDRLLEYCAIDFDYIGAPSAKWDWKKLGQVINGGVSLRKISTHIEVTEHKEEIMQGLSVEWVRELNGWEDRYFAFCGRQINVRFRVAPLEIGKDFCVMYNIHHSYEHLRDKLPFACHRWCDDNLGVWLPVLEQLGYVLPNEEVERRIKESHYYAFRYTRHYHPWFLKRVLAEGYNGKVSSIIRQLLPKGVTLVVWGAGQDGRRCLALLALAQITVKAIYDMGKAGEYLEGHIIECPKTEDIKRTKQFVLIATRKYEMEIERTLMASGVTCFMSSATLEINFLKMYYQGTRWGNLIKCSSDREKN